MALLRTYSLKDAVGFIQYLLEKQQEDVMWEVWLHRKPSKKQGNQERQLSFEEFRKAVKPASARGKKAQTVTAEEEKERLEFASRYIKARKEAADNGSI